jgi:diamine N-acetyltransferase
MIVIKADSSHAEYLSDFGGKSFIHAYQCTLPVEDLRRYVEAAFSESAIHKEMDASLATYFICLDSESNPCGYSKLIHSSPPECVQSDSGIELQRLYVHTDYRDHGVGKHLELHTEAFAQHRNIRDIWLRVWEGNVVAQQIYHTWGYSVVGEEMYQVGNGQRTVLIMQKALSGRKADRRSWL